MLVPRTSRTRRRDRSYGFIRVMTVLTFRHRQRECVLLDASPHPSSTCLLKGVGLFAFGSTLRRAEPLTRLLHRRMFCRLIIADGDFTTVGLARDPMPLHWECHLILDFLNCSFHKILSASGMTNGDSDVLVFNQNVRPAYAWSMG
jgi:hypothetical protein